MHSEYPAIKILSELESSDLVPCILFRTSRKQCDSDVERLSSSKVGKLSDDVSKNLKKEVNSIIAFYGMEEEVIFNHPHFQALVETGVGAHHAGQLLLWRLLLEELMTRGLLRMMIATGTVAAGVDFPARTVVITAHSKRGSDGFNILTSSEFQQMSGRAGRRGKDAVGICLIAPSPYSDARVINEVAFRPAEPLRSAYFAAPSTVLNLLKHRNVDDLHYTVSKSLAAFLDRKSAKKIKAEASKEEARLIEENDFGKDIIKKKLKKIRRQNRDADILENKQKEHLKVTLESLGKLGHINETGLTEKGLWAAELCTSLVLELSEAIDSGLLYDLSVEELAGVVGSISGDAYRNYFSIRQNPIKKEYFREMENLVNKVQVFYTDPKKVEMKVREDSALTVLTWMESEDWNSFAGLLRLSGVAEGDAARLITQTADHLGQLMRLRESHPPLAETATEARKRLLRSPLSDGLLVNS